MADVPGGPVNAFAAGGLHDVHDRLIDPDVENAVVELTDSTTGELIYCRRVKGKTFKAPVFNKGNYTLKAGKDRAEAVLLNNVKPE